MNSKPHTANRFNVVSRRHLRLSARRMDLPRTGMETPYPESHYRSIVTPNLLPVAYTGSIQQVSPLFSGLYFVDSLFLVALYRTVQSWKTGLTNKNKRLNIKRLRNETFQYHTIICNHRFSAALAVALVLQFLYRKAGKDSLYPV